MIGRRLLRRSGTTVRHHEDHPSMLRSPIVFRPPAGAHGSRPADRSDRAMDVLQYGMAILALAVALVLAGLH
jgi:hypothetical protein